MVTTEKTEKTASAALPLSKVAELLDRVAEATGERDPAKLLDLIKAALQQTPMPAVDMAASHDAAVALAKAVAGEPMRECAVGGVPDAVAEFSLRRDHLEHLAKNAGGVPEVKLREARGDAEAVAIARGLEPMRRGFPAAGPWEDNRNELRARRDEMRRLGHADVAEALQREIDVAEARAATQTPSTTIGWGGVARPLTAA